MLCSSALGHTPPAAVRRKQETEADTIGVMLAARACFDPKAAVTVFTKLGKKEEEMLQGRRVPQFMLTHPLSTVSIVSCPCCCPSCPLKSSLGRPAQHLRYAMQARVKAITKNLPKAEREYELSDCNAPRTAFFGFP